MVWVKWWRWSRLTRIGKEKFRVNWSYIFKASCDFLPRGTRQTIKGRLPSRPSTLGSPPSCNNMSKRSYRNSQSLTCLEENYCILNDKKLNLALWCYSQLEITDIQYNNIIWSGNQNFVDIIGQIMCKGLSANWFPKFYPTIFTFICNSFLHDLGR